MTRVPASTPQAIETGTFLGDTTALLARRARMISSIEPDVFVARSH
jgi:hypothetical protein